MSNLGAYRHHANATTRAHSKLLISSLSPLSHGAAFMGVVTILLCVPRGIPTHPLCGDATHNTREEREVCLAANQVCLAAHTKSLPNSKRSKNHPRITDQTTNSEPQQNLGLTPDVHPQGTYWVDQNDKWLRKRDRGIIRPH